MITEAINIEGLSDDELRSKIKEWLGTDDEPILGGPVYQYRLMARHLLEARKWRRQGAIGLARQHEAIIDDKHSKLPEELKW